jgi:hypothetical protein
MSNVKIAKKLAVKTHTRTIKHNTHNLFHTHTHIHTHTHTPTHTQKVKAHTQTIKCMQTHTQPFTYSCVKHTHTCTHTHTHTHTHKKCRWHFKRLVKFSQRRQKKIDQKTPRCVVLKRLSHHQA